MGRAESGAERQRRSPGSRTGAGAAGDDDRRPPQSRHMELKLRPPRPTLALVERRSVVAGLAASRAPLVLVSAPAGAGKTLALLQWVEAGERPFVWIKLDTTDDDPVVLLRSLVAGLTAVTAVDRGLLDRLELAAPPVDEEILPGIVAALDSAAPFVLVLDDAQHVDSPRCWQIVAVVVAALPPGAQVALATRKDPPLPLAALRTRGELAEVRGDRLAFSRDETAALLRAHGPRDDASTVDDATLDAVLAATEGWAAGVYLAVLAGHDLEGPRASARWLARLHGDRREVTEYLATEVLERQPDDVRDFLLRTSLLEHVGTAECRALTGRRDAHEVLARLAAENLFVVPVAGEAGAYRYHHLFAEFLRAEFARRDPDEMRRLQLAAAEWFSARGDVEQAVHHWLAGGDVQQAADTVARVWPAMWNRGRLETVRRWLGDFSDDQILAHPGLTLSAGWVLTALSDARLGERWGQAACSARLPDAPSPDGAVSLRSSQALLRATLGLDGVARMREDAELAAATECTPGASWYADAQGILGVALWLSGAVRRAETALERAARDGAVSNASAELAALGTLSLIAADRGDWEAARDHADRAAACLEQSGFGTRRRSLPMLLARARLLTREAHPGLGEVEEQVVRLLERMVPHPWMTLLAGVMLGEALLETGDARSAQGWSRRADELLRHYPDPGILGPRARRLRAAVEEAAGAEALTAAERRVLELLPTHMNDRQIAERLFVSRNTVKTHLRGLYRKLGATSRAEAVERARGLGLLRKL